MADGTWHPGAIKCYLAAPFQFQLYARGVRDQLVAEGFHVTSRWLDVEPDADQAMEAANDVFDVLQSDVMLVLNLAKSEGKAVEQGIALVRGIPVFVIGDGPTNVFQHLKPQFTFARDLGTAIDAMNYHFN